MTRQIATTERRSRMARRHRLLATERTDDVPVIVDDLVALHGTDPATVFVSAGVRMRNPSIAAIEHALQLDRSLHRHHAMRRTIWVMTAAVVKRAHVSSTAKIAKVERRKLLALLDAAPEIDHPESWLDDAFAKIEEHLAQEGTSTTRAIGKALPALAVKIELAPGTKNAVAVSAHSRVVVQAAFEARIVRTKSVGSWNSAEYQWSLKEGWTGDTLADEDLRKASSELVSHYLERFGPCTDTDIRWWTGWTATQVGRALVDCQAISVEFDNGIGGWLAAGDREPEPPVEPWVALLPSLDPTTMGWKEREWYLDDDVKARVFDRNGNAGPTLWVDGRIVGGWAQRGDGEIAMEIQHDVGAEAIAALEAEAARIIDLIGETRLRVRFPSPNQKALVV